MCVGYTPTTRSCSKFCTTDADCEAPGGLCAIDITDGSGNEIPNATLCSQDCDLITSDGCNATGTSCQFAVRAMMDPYTLCAPSGAGVDDAPCSTNADCASGFVCLTNAQMVSQCYQWCNTAAPACPMAQVCQGLEIQPGVPLLIGDIHYGACT
jgi:Cys-rich repeat protein